MQCHGLSYRLLRYGRRFRNDHVKTYRYYETAAGDSDRNKQHEQGHHELAELLLQREVIFTEDAERIFGKRQWESRTDTLQKENETSEPAPATPPPFDKPND